MWRILLCVLLVGCAGNNHNEYIGEKYIGAKYVANPLGEGTPPDPDPNIRFDAFDCTTFVETALADGDIDKLTKIRYRDGNVDFANRNHFIETDWMANNSDIVKNITQKFGPTSGRRVTIDKQKWFKTMYGINVAATPQTIDLEYIPYSRALDIVVDRPVVVLFVRGDNGIKNKIGTDLAIRHMGFLLPDGRLRHASKRRGRVVDMNFVEYAKQMMKNKNNLGIMILEIKK